MKVTIVTMDSHLCAAAERAHRVLVQALPGVRLTVHAAAEWGDQPAKLQACLDDIASADIVIATMLFMEDHVRAVAPAMEARRESCDAMVVCMSAGDAARLTRMGRFTTHSSGGLRGFLKKLRGKTEKSGVAGAQQMKMLRRIPRPVSYTHLTLPTKRIV